MRRHRITTLACVVWLGSSCAHEGAEAPEKPASQITDETPVSHSILTGTVLGEDGQPLTLGHARLYGPGKRGANFLAEVELDADGGFELSTDVTGYAELELTGVDHAELRFGVLLEPGTHALAIRLGTYPRPETHATIQGRGKRGAGGAFEPFELQRRDDGTFVAELDVPPLPEPKPEPEPKPAAAEPDPADAYRASLDAVTDDEFIYQLTGIDSSGRILNGTQAARYLYDGGGDYRSVVTIEGETLAIVFDPGQLPAAGAEPVVEWGEPASSFARVGALSLLAEGWLDEWTAAMRTAASNAEQSGEAAYADAVAKAGDALRVRAAAAIAETDDELSLRVLLIYHASFGFPEHDDPAHQALLDRALSEISPTDPLWSLQSGALANAIEHSSDPEAWTAYVDEAIAGHPDPTIGAQLLYSRVVEAEAARQMDEARQLYAKLQGERFAGTTTQRFAVQINPDRPTAPGKPVPEFEVPSIDDPGKTITRADMLGQVYIIDFWATWCVPCKAELPDLHGLFADSNGQARPAKGRKYARPRKRDQQLEILSISFDASTKDVVAYRKNEWPMPWRHAFADAAKRDQLREDFAFVGIPNMLLIDEHGTIVATSGELRGEDMHETVAAFFAERAKAPVAQR